MLVNAEALRVNLDDTLSLEGLASDVASPQAGRDVTNPRQLARSIGEVRQAVPVGAGSTDQAP